MTPRPESQDALRFERARSWRAWHEWPGFMGLATGIALWVFFVTGVLAPVGDALARFRSPAGVVPVEVCVTADDGTIAAAGQPCVCACPEPPAAEPLPRSG